MAKNTRLFPVRKPGNNRVHIGSGHQVGLYGLEKTGSILRVQDTQGAVEAHAAQPQDGPAVCLHLAALHTDGEKQLRDDADKIVNIIDG